MNCAPALDATEPVDMQVPATRSNSIAKNWIVVLDKPPPGSQDEVVQLIIQTTGWPAETAEVELACGFPITLAAALTLAEALELRGVAIECGLSTEIKSMSTK